MAVLSEGKFPYTVFIMMMTIIAYAKYSLYKAKKNICLFFWISDERVTVGDMLEMGYTLTNTGIIPIANAQIRCNIAKRLGNMTLPVENAFLRPFGIIRVKRDVLCRHRGYYTLGEFTVSVCSLAHHDRNTRWIPIHRLV